MKFLILGLLFGCATAPSSKKLTYQDVQHKECLAPVENLRLTPAQTFMKCLSADGRSCGNSRSNKCGSRE